MMLPQSKKQVISNNFNQNPEESIDQYLQPMEEIKENEKLDDHDNNSKKKSVKY